MKENRLQELIHGFGRYRVAVVGDFALDRYGFGEFSGRSRETGNPVLRLYRQEFSPGGAGNVSWNLADLGANVSAVTILGEDAYMGIYREELEKRGIDTEHLVADPTRVTGSFEKLKAFKPDGSYEDEFRVDVDNENPVSEDAQRELVERLKGHLDAIDAVVVADYNEAGMGIITPDMLTDLCALAKGSDKLWVATSRTRIEALEGMIAVPNDLEAVTASGLHKPDLFEELAEDLVRRAGSALIATTGEPAFVTRGEKGMTIFREEVEPSTVPTVPAAGEIDITGAGDTALSAITLSLCAGATFEEAASIANMAAYIILKKLGTTGTASPEEIFSAHRDVFQAGR